jgi:hypothetical protein
MAEPGLLWTARDHEGDVGELRRAIPSDPVYRDADVLGLLRVNGSGFLVETDTARDLRDALNRMLVDDGGSAETGRPQASVEGWQALHGALHGQLQRRARRIGQTVSEQVLSFARVVDQARAAEEAGPRTGVDPNDRARMMAALVTLLAVQQQKTAALLGDLLAAIEGQP